MHPWIINQRLKDAGWQPDYTNAEAYIDDFYGPWSNMNAKQRQRASLVGAILVGGLITFLISRLIQHLRDEVETRNSSLYPTRYTYGNRSLPNKRKYPIERFIRFS